MIPVGAFAAKIYPGALADEAVLGKRPLSYRRDKAVVSVSASIQSLRVKIDSQYHGSRATP